MSTYFVMSLNFFSHKQATTNSLTKIVNIMQSTYIQINYNSPVYTRSVKILCLRENQYDQRLDLNFFFLNIHQDISKKLFTIVFQYVYNNSLVCQVIISPIILTADVVILASGFYDDGNNFFPQFIIFFSFRLQDGSQLISSMKKGLQN